MPDRPAPRLTPARILAATIALFSVMGLTLAPRSLAWPARTLALDALSLLPPWWSGILLGGDIDRALNVAIFLPLGAAVALVLPLRWAAASVLVGSAVSCAVEIVQSVVPGRVPDVADILANTLGTLLGTIAVIVVRLVARAGRDDSARHAKAGS